MSLCQSILPQPLANKQLCVFKLSDLGRSDGQKLVSHWSFYLLFLNMKEVEYFFFNVHLYFFFQELFLHIIFLFDCGLFPKQLGFLQILRKGTFFIGIAHIALWYVCLLIQFLLLAIQLFINSFGTGFTFAFTASGFYVTLERMLFYLK